VAQAVHGHPEALAFLRDMARVMHTWDDLCDRDKPISDGMVTDAFWTALVTLPRNSFYREHEADLQPIVVNAILNWRIATHIERMPATTETLLHTAFIIRSSYIDMVTMSALLIDGPDWATHVGPGLRAWAHGEGFDNYLHALAREKEARDGAERAA
jgi:hypothetical protein